MHKLFQINNHDYYEHVKNCDGKNDDGKRMCIILNEQK
jgi:hypothetical protein